MGAAFYSLFVMELADDAREAPHRGDGSSGVGSHSAGQPGFNRLAAAGEGADAAYVPRTLSGELRRRGHLPFEECLKVAFALAAALGHLHKHGLVHRDLKPSNVIFVHGSPKIADIGLVAASGATRSLVGTEGFLPPQGPGTPTADLYALGKVLYEASTGQDRLRFPQIPPEWLTDASQAVFLEFNEIVVRACETDPQRRYRSAAEMLADLALLQAGRSLRHMDRLEAHLRLARRSGALALGLALLAGVGYGLAVRQAGLERQSRQRIERAENEARQQLAEARLAQARALRRTGEAGQRFDCMEVVATTARTQPTLELRNEAIAALALVDIRLARRLPPNEASRAEPMFDLARERYFWGDAAGNLHLRRMADDAELLCLAGSGRPPYSLLPFGPDGRFVAVRPKADCFVVWDLDTRAKVFEVPPQPDGVWGQLLADGPSMVWGAGREPLRRFDLATQQPRGEWPVPFSVWRFCCSPDERLVALAYADTNLLDIVSLADGRVVTRIPQPSRAMAVRWQPGQRALATANDDNVIRLWDAVSAEERLAFRGHEGTPASLAFHPGGELLASAGWDGTTRLWDLRSGLQAVWMREAGDHLEFSPDGRHLAFGEYSDAHALVCDVAGDTICRLLEGPPARGDQRYSAVEFDSEGRTLAAADSSGIQLFDVELGRLLGTREVGPVRSLVFGAAGRELIGAGEAGLLRWSLTPDWEGRIRLDETRVLADTNRLCNSVCRVGHALAWTHVNTLHVQDGEREIACLAIHAEMSQLAASPDGRWLAASDHWRYSVDIWETASWTKRYTVPFAGRSRLAFSPDSTFLVVGVPDEYVFWDLAAGVARHHLTRQQTSTARGPLAFSTDGKLLAILRTRTLIVLVAYPGLRELAALELPHPEEVECLAFDPTGTRLAAGCARHHIALWDLRRLRGELARLGLDW